MLKILFRSLATSISLVGLASAQSLPLSDYIALQPGTWTYTKEGGASPVVNATATDYTRVVSIDGGTLTNTLRLTDDGLILLGEVSTLPDDFYTETDDPVTVIIPPVLVIDGPVTSDMGTFTSTSPDGPYTGTRTVTTEVNDFENITVDAGSFSALEVIATIAWADDEESGVVINTFWLAKGHGVVRFRVKQEGFDETFDLISSPDRPEAPTGGSSTPQAGSVQLRWPKVAGTDFYRVYRADTPVFASAVLVGTAAQPVGPNADFADASTVGTTAYHYFLESVIGTAPSVASAAIVGSALPEMSFSTSLTDSGLSGDDALADADPNGDGIENGIAYGLGIPLVGAVTAEELGRLPESTAPSASGRPVIKAILPDDAPDDVTYLIETATSLSSPTWLEVARKVGDGVWSGTADVSVESPIDGFACVEVEGPETIATEPVGFMRLRVLIGE